MRRTIVYLAASMLLFAAAGSVYGQVSLKQLESQRKAAQKDIELTTQLLNETRSSAKASLNRLDLISKKILDRKKVINLLNQEINLIDKNIATMHNELSGLEKDLIAKRENYTHSLQNLYTRHSSQYKWLFVLSADNFAQSVRRMRYLAEYANWQKHQANRIVAKQHEITQKQLTLEQTRAEKLDLLSIREAENSKLQEEESEQKNEVQHLNKKQKDLQALLDKKKKQAEALDRHIESLIVKDTDSSVKDKEIPRVAEIKGGYAMTKDERKLSSDFASNKGRLPYPITGKYKVVVPFGENQHPQWKHVRLNNNGIQIQTTSGAEAQAVFDGVVTAKFVEPGYNNGVIIRHGNYITFYANLSKVYVNTGDKVSTYQKIGEIFTDTENGNATILYFEIRKETDKLNPEQWLKR
ncbi:MAG: peptidoglycan DD-metalloendopeptidase family protein [Tannerella sp.]|nr:peptidoglycan DD-metalloendopeptidase family protein [Tannerella sp.]